ncbi:MAG: hypothetical protein H7289_02035, partial [Mucilaginibacter sp.]|nr:hypothetical protein [Mucilaginibacter sp.]
MKTLATLLITGLFYCTTVSAQVKKHHIDYQVIEDDSVRISMNEEFHVTGAACGQVIRYTHLDTQRNVFIGRFKDVSTSNPQLVITEGGYDALGRKNGDFITRYSNGEFMA